ncbi:hypothetical protein AGMMS50230_02770 [Spirochaetia bacterium]|nr:hypothetical protein AGMMS50230_02770 [Spirochaetia bacterium]
MVSIKRYLTLPLFFFLGGVIFSQAVLLSAETAAIEKKLSNPRLSAVDRKAALENMARLFELSGNVEGAAEAWNEAAAAIPARGHPDLLRSARCLAATGEFDRAEAVLRPVLSSTDRSLYRQARLLGAQIEALKTGTSGLLTNLLSDPDYAEYKPAMYYTIWRVSGGGESKNRLLAEFPQSPEARLVRSAETDKLSAAPTALWLLAGASPLPAVNPPNQGNPAPAVPVLPAETSPIAQNVPTAQISPGSPLMFQTGLFSREENAKVLAERLRKAGFSPVISKKYVNGADYWAVGAAPGPDPSRTMLLLRDKGFESFPVY